MHKYTRQTDGLWMRESMDGGGGLVAHAQTRKPSMRVSKEVLFFFCSLHLCFILGISGPVGLILISE